MKQQIDWLSIRVNVSQYHNISSYSGFLMKIKFQCSLNVSLFLLQIVTCSVSLVLFLYHFFVIILAQQERMLPINDSNEENIIFPLSIQFDIALKQLSKGIINPVWIQLTSMILWTKFFQGFCCRIFHNLVSLLFHRVMHSHRHILVFTQIFKTEWFIDEETYNQAIIICGV